MNKKNIGAALSVVAAVTAGATVYASTINNLESDKNTKAMITPYYTDSANDYYSLVQSDYTNDLKNTTIANEKRVVLNTNDTKEEVAEIERKAQEIAKTTIYVHSQNEADASDKYEIEEVEEVADSEDVAIDDTETSETAETEEELVVYDDRNLDDVLELIDEEEELEVKETEVAEVNYLDQAEENTEANTEENTEVEATKAHEEEIEATEEVEESLYTEQFVNTEALNMRSSKSTEEGSNIVRTIKAGDKVSGSIEGEWLKTNEGYVKLAFLSEAYPQELVDSINARNEEVAEAETVTEEAPIEEVTTNETAVEEVAPVAEAAPAEEVEETNQVAEEVEEIKGQAFTGWVYNTQVLNVRDRAKTGNIIGTLNKGNKVTGELIDGWVKIDFNGSVAYVSSAYLTTTETSEEVAETTEKVEQVKYEEDLAVTEEAAPAPVQNGNGQQAASIASQYAGHPYVWGSSNPAVGFDCSGLVVNAYRQLGVSLPHSSAAQFSTGYAVNSSNLQAGDLVFFSIRGGGIDHVGIVTSSDGTFIHASTPQSGVKYDNVFNNYYQNKFQGARRIF